MDIKKFFGTMAKKTAAYSGHPAAFITAFTVVVIWAVTGPVFHYSETWQLVINTGTTIITFLMVFLIQSSQNRDTAAIQLKLDELIRVTKGAHNVLLDLEDLNEDELARFKEKYEKIASSARNKVKGGGKDSDPEEVVIDDLCKVQDDPEQVKH